MKWVDVSRFCIEETTGFTLLRFLRLCVNTICYFDSPLGVVLDPSFICVVKCFGVFAVHLRIVSSMQESMRPQVGTVRLGEKIIPPSRVSRSGGTIESC